MDTAKKEILELLAERKIEVAEAERLLEALEARDRRSKSRPEPRLRRDLNQALASVQESLSGLGPQLKRAFGSGEANIDLDLDFDIKLDDEPLGEEIDLGDGILALPEGSELRIEHKPEKLQGSADLDLSASPDERLHIHGEGTDGLRLHKSSKGPVIRWRKGPLQVEVPTAVLETRVRLIGGDLVARELPGNLSAKTAGGDTELRSPGGDFRMQCAGGRLEIDLHAGWSGQGQVSSAGGDVDAKISAMIPSGHIEAKAVGSEIVLEGDFLGADPESILVGQRFDLRFGGGSPVARLKFKSVGGDLRLERS